MIKTDNSIFTNFIQILKFSKKKRLTQIFLLFILSIISLIFEILSVGSLMPFIQVLINPEENNMINKIFIIDFIFAESSGQNKIFVFMIIFITLVVISYVVKILLIWFSAFLNHNIGHEINSQIFKKTVNKNYSYHVKNNSSKFIGNIEKSDRFKSAISYIFQLLISLVMVIGLLMFLFFLDSNFIISLSFVGILIYLLIYYLLRKQMLKNSIIEANEINKRIQILQETSLNIREIIISKLQEHFFKDFKKSDNNLKKIVIKNIIYTNIPGNFILMVATVILSILIYYYSLKQGGLETNLPLLAAILFLLQKLLPQLQFIYQSFSKLKIHSIALYDVKKLLISTTNDLPKKSIQKNNLVFNKDIKIKNGRFSYSNNSEIIFKNLNLEISKGGAVLILGETGAGKSTVLDLLMGLIELDEGELTVDNNSINSNNINDWQEKISHIPQSSGFLDSTILENITFENELEKIDEKKLIEVTRISEIYEFINSTKQKFLTHVGEKAIQLSGGQRQRIALARALYNDKEVLFMDEATNALDKITERKIFYNIKSKNSEKTIICISHRESINEFFDTIYNVQKNIIEKIK